MNNIFIRVNDRPLTLQSKSPAATRSCWAKNDGLSNSGDGFRHYCSRSTSSVIVNLQAFRPIPSVVCMLSSATTRQPGW